MVNFCFHTASERWCYSKRLLKALYAKFMN